MSGRAATNQIIAGEYALSVGAANLPHPDHWLQVALTDVARLESGHTPSRKHPEWWGGEVPWISIPDARVHHGKVITETKGYTNDDGLANSAARLLPAGTVCLSRTASVGYATVMGRPMATSQDFVNWVCSDFIEPHWLKYLFIAEERALKHRFGKGTTHTTIYYPEVKAFHVCLPPLNEQRRIVAKIDALQTHSRKARAALDRIPALLERFRQSVLAAAFRGDLTADWRAKNPNVEHASELLKRIRVERKAKWIEADAEKARARAEARAKKKGAPWGPADDEKALGAARKKAEKKYKEPEPVDAEAEGLPELPAGWVWSRIDETSVGQSYGTAKKSKPTGQVPVLRMGNMQSGEIDWSNLAFTDDDDDVVKYALAPDTVLFNRTNSPVWVGKTAIYRGERPAIYAGYLIRIQHVAGILPAYLNWVLNSPLGRAWCWDVKTDGVSQSNISGSKLARFAFPVCSEQEQARIVALVEAAMHQTRRHTSYFETLTSSVDALDQAILAKAFRGELVPQDPNDEPASVLLERIMAEREVAAAERKAAKKKRGRR